MPVYEHRFPYPMNRLHQMLSGHPEFSPRMITHTGATLAVKPDVHDGFTVVLALASGIAVTLPAATGSGAKYELVIGTTITSNTTTIKVANSTDVMVGQIETATTTGATTNGFCEAAGGTDDTITMNGTTLGGIAGSRIELLDLKAGFWLVRGMLVGSGTLATTLSATV